MSLLDWIAPLRECASQLRRIADALDQIVERQYGWHMRPLKADTSGGPPDVSYADDASMLRCELEDIVRGTAAEREEAEQPAGEG